MSGWLKPGDTLADYRITRVLDQGGMGEVYEAVEEYSEDVVAIKCLSPRHTAREDFVRRFRQECKFYPKLKHPNIVRMRRAGVSADNVAFIVMDLLEGKTLRKLLHKAGRLDLLQALHIMIQVADAMRFAHAKGIWHRDLKPENIMVGTSGDAKGHVWVLDFGIAKSVEGGVSTEDLPDVGTVRYMAPEQARNIFFSSKKASRLKSDGRADIYAFGAVLYEVLAGRHLFIDDEDPPGLAETLSGHLHAEPTPIHEIVPECPEPVWSVVARCVAIDREQRYQTFDEVARALRALIGEAVPEGHPLARRMLEERMRAERDAAFAAVPLDDDELPFALQTRKPLDPASGAGFATPAPGTARRAEATDAGASSARSGVISGPAPAPATPRPQSALTPAGMTAPARPPARPYVLAPLVGLAVALAGTGAVLALRAWSRGGAPAPEPAGAAASAIVGAPAAGPAGSVAAAATPEGQGPALAGPSADPRDASAAPPAGPRRGAAGSSRAAPRAPASTKARQPEEPKPAATRSEPSPAAAPPPSRTPVVPLVEQEPKRKKSAF